MHILLKHQSCSIVSRDGRVGRSRCKAPGPGPVRQYVVVRATPPADGDASAPQHQNIVCNEDLPEELRDLAISEDGFLIDSKTGKVINEFGATRFDVAVRALRGELDPPEWVDNTERTPGVILSSLFQFPKPYIFQVVGKPGQGQEEQAGDGKAAAADAFVQHVAGTVARVCQVPREEAVVEVKERMGGRFVSVSVEVVVRAPELISSVFEALEGDPRVVMKF